MSKNHSDIKIAVVDDEADLLDMYNFELMDFGFQSKTFEHATEAAVAIINGDFDLVISDIRMPKLNGLDLLKKVKEELANPPPFIFVTGFSQFTKEELTEAGAEEVFHKPLDIEVVVKWIDSYFS